jgi:hypothetical protein
VRLWRTCLKDALRWPPAMQQLHQVQEDVQVEHVQGLHVAAVCCNLAFCMACIRVEHMNE